MDQNSHVLDILVQRRREKEAAKRFSRKLLKRLTYVPRVIVTGQLKNDSAAKHEVLPSVEHRQHKCLNNRVENSQQPARQRERPMQGCKSPEHVQPFLAGHSPIAQHFHLHRYCLSAPYARQKMGNRFPPWQEITRLPSAA